MTRLHALPLFGRADAVLALRDHVRRRTVIRISGPAGVGKTQLAMAALGDGRIDWRWVDLAGVTRHDQARVEFEFRGGWAGNPDARGVVLDGVDGIVSALPGLLSHRPPGVPVIVTVRADVTLPDSVSLALGPLAPDAALAMLRHVCAAREIDLTLAEQAAILSNLDGLPGAILSASRWLAVECAAEVNQRIVREGLKDAALLRSNDGPWARLDDDAQAVFSETACIAGAQLATLGIATGVSKVERAIRVLLRERLVQRLAGQVPRFAPYATTRAFALSRITPVGRAAHVQRLSVEVMRAQPRVRRALACPYAVSAEGDPAMAVHVWQHAEDQRIRVAAGLMQVQHLIRWGPASRCQAIASQTQAAAQALGDPSLMRWATFAVVCAEVTWTGRVSSAFEALDAPAIGRQDIGRQDAVLARAVARWRARSVPGADSMAHPAPEDVIEHAEDAFTEGCSQPSVPGALAQLRRALALIEGRPAPLAVHAGLAIGHLHLRQGDVQAALAIFEDLQAGPAFDHHAQVRRALSLAKAHLALGQLEPARQAATRALETCRAVEDERNASWAQRLLGTADLLDWDASVDRAQLRAQSNPQAAALLHMSELMRNPAASIDARLPQAVEVLIDQGRSVDAPGASAQWALRSARLLADASPDDPACPAHRTTLLKGLQASAKDGVATRLMRILIARVIAHNDAGLAGLTVDAAGFCLSGGAHVSLQGRPVLLRLLHRLAQARVRAPGRGVSVEVLTRWIWPEEQNARALRRRLQSNVYHLRQAGLSGLLIASAAGYQLSTTLPVALKGVPDAG